MSAAKQILLIEDSPQDVELIRIALAEMHFTSEIAVARDGEEALDYLYRRRMFESRIEGDPSFMMLDLKLPKIDGLELLKQVKRYPALKCIPVVMLTSSREEQDVVKSYALGVNAYVVKPVAFDKFVEAIKQIGLFWGLINQPPPGCIS